MPASEDLCQAQFIPSRKYRGSPAEAMSGSSQLKMPLRVATAVFQFAKASNSDSGTGCIFQLRSKLRLGSIARNAGLTV